MFNGQRLCLSNLTLHVLGSQFLLQQFDLREGEGNEDKIKVECNQVNSQVFTVTQKELGGSKCTG